ncbi:class II aldolase/adducin family protein [Bradyrhizobium sp. AZCC 2230]|uniref:class II aldolase/adducin family protein n=1 Tax=Bradyrhizobium sp. AZCC 2230 TaxID=3117021 RepID=UPI002FF331EC
MMSITNELDYRRDLAALFRALGRMGMNEQIANHNSFMLPGSDDLFLINPRGLHFKEITASSLILCNMDGEVVEGDGELRKVAFHIHVGIHRMHPQARCILHVHPQYLTGLSMAKRGRMELAHQNSLALCDRIAYDEVHNGPVLNDDEGVRIARLLGDKTILLMGNHGVTVVGPSIHDAFDELYMAERTAMYQMTAQSAGLELQHLDDSLRYRWNGAWSERFDARSHLDAWRRILDREEPDYAN